jgi:hypothetical protein
MGSELPWWLVRGGEYNAAGSLSFRFGADIGAAVSHKRPRKALPHESGIDFTARRRADCHQTTVVVPISTLACDGLSGGQSFQCPFRRPSIRSGATLRVLALLSALWCIASKQSDAGGSKIEGVSVDDAG